MLKITYSCLSCPNAFEKEYASEKEAAIDKQTLKCPECESIFVNATKVLYIP